MAKAWLRERWASFFVALDGLTVEQEEEIKRLCEQEREYIRNRPTMKSISSLKEPMSDTRNALRELPFTDANSWFNPKEGKREHLALKYMNWEDAEWALMNKPSNDRMEERLEAQILLDQPGAIVAKARELLTSSHWPDIAVALAVLCGRRLSEVLKMGSLHPKTLYTVLFSGQLKRADAALKPYEIPVLAPAAEVLAAWSRIRTLVDCSKMESELIGKTYSTQIGESAERHFRDLIPVHEEDADSDANKKKPSSGLFMKLFRAVYPRLAVYYFCPPTVSDLAYVPTILGHYWASNDTEEQKRNYMSSLYYFAYRIGNGEGNIDGRQGIRLSEPGVDVLEILKQKEKQPMVVRTKKAAEKVISETETGLVVEKASQTGYSSLRPRVATKARFDQIIVEEQIKDSSPADAVLSLLIDEHYILKQLKQYETALDGLAAVLAEAVKDKNKDETAVAFLSRMIEERRSFKQSYVDRGAGRDYSQVETSKLIDIKKPEAARERFKRGIDAIIAYNDAAAVPELRWHINPKSLTDLVGGKPAIASEYLATRPDVEAHHTKYGLKAAYNRRSVKIKERVTVPELPGAQPTAPVELHHDEIAVENVQTV